MKHYGIVNLANIILPGRKKNLLPFSWVACKTCSFRGIGYDRYGDAKKHQVKKHKGDMLNFNIYCRLCAKDDTHYEYFENGDEFEYHMVKKHQDLVKLLPN